MAVRWPRNVIVANGNMRRSVRPRCESLPIGREYRSADCRQGLCSGVSLRVFTEREGEGP
jgi:hypothetical protein